MSVTTLVISVEPSAFSSIRPPSRLGVEPPPKEEDKEAWKKLLREMDPKDFGRYKI